MAFIDQITFFAKAGKGGDGVVRWRKEKFEDRGGPWGGDGGRGGHVFVEGERNIMILTRIAHIKDYKAEKGFPGQSASKHGRDGENLTIKLPLGSVVTNLDTGEVIELMQEGVKYMILEGGFGGHGNEHFKSSTNVAPDFATPGQEGQSAHFSIELRIIADAGFVGFPNAGKSTLLSELTNASPKIGNYAFTTLSPNLGAMDGYILADIPGIIEDASLGKGLGIEFLRHVSRTRLLIHCISLERDSVSEAYFAIRKELDAFGQGITEKPEIVVLTKTDMVDAKRLGEAITELAGIGKEALVVSTYDEDSLKSLRSRLSRALFDLGQSD